MGDLVIPAGLRAEAVRQHRERWLADLPRVVTGLAARWSLRVDEPFLPGGQSAWVAPVVGRDGRDLVLKVCWPHFEALHEAAGLRLWAGEGSVLVEDDAMLEDGSTALLIERCVPGTTLRSLPEVHQDQVLAGILPRLWRRRPPPGHPFRALATMCDQWADRYESLPGSERAGVDPGLQRAGMALLRELPRTSREDVLLCTDLHAGNVLAAERAPWLVIDPKPYVGDPAYDVTQHLLNCDRRLQADPEALLRRFAGLLDLDAERVGLWLLARCIELSSDWTWLAEVARRLARSRHLGA